MRIPVNQFGTLLTLTLLLCTAPALGAKDDIDDIVHPLVANAREEGLDKCLEELGRAASKVTGNTPYGAVFDVHNEKPNKNIANIIVTQGDEQSGANLLVLNLAPMRRKCDTSFTRVQVWPQDCATLQRTVLGKFNFNSTLPGNMVLADTGTNARIFAIPGKQGCVTVVQGRF